LDGSLRAANEAISDRSAEGLSFGPDVADPLFADAVKIVRESGHGSIAELQRTLNIRYNRAARLVTEMERIGVVSAADERGHREVLAPSLMND
jgi:S-DNA-T family DNA segregation ATPase FtsK/SpoIIIE